MENLIHGSCGTIEKPYKPFRPIWPVLRIVAVVSAAVTLWWLWIEIAIMCSIVACILVVFDLTNISHAWDESTRVVVIEDKPLDELVEVEEVDTSDPPAEEWLERLTAYVKRRAPHDPEAALLWLELGADNMSHIAFTTKTLYTKFALVGRTYIYHTKTGVLLGRWCRYNGFMELDDDDHRRYLQTGVRFENLYHSGDPGGSGARVGVA